VIYRGVVNIYVCLAQKTIVVRGDTRVASVAQQSYAHTKGTEDPFACRDMGWCFLAVWQ
jgi:hypothetical protein